MDSKEILLIDKPAGLTSFGVVARVRRKLSQQAGHKVKVGHAGTLDPFATGLLILLVGKGTKQAQQLLKLDKTYEATICLGATSTTGDPEGEIRPFASSALSSTPTPIQPPAHTQIRTVLQAFTGSITQRVPRYSAVKINGRRAYQLARQGTAVTMPTRQVTIYRLELLSYRWPNLTIRCAVSSGTYIRTLGEDIGAALGVGGYLTALRRLQIGDFHLKDAKNLETWLSL